MHSLSLVAFAIFATLYALVWHDRPSRTEPGRSGEDSAPSKAGRMDWMLVIVWGFVFLSFAAVLLAGYIIWARVHG